MRRLKRFVLLLAVVSTAVVTSWTVLEPAAAQACGFIGNETYRHCDARTRVLIDARNFWGTTYRNICVRPGDTYLGYLSYWRIINAWYIGRTC